MKVFVSYRRSDSRTISHWIADSLRNEFGRSNVFIDIDSLDPGVDYRSEIQKSIRKSDVLVAVIGPQWAHARTQSGKRRIELQEDQVRLEIECALDSNVPVIPVLVDGASMPTEDTLPLSIAKLANFQALPIQDGPGFRGDLHQAIAAAKKIVAERQWESFKTDIRWHRKQLYSLLSVVAIIAVLAVAAVPGIALIKRWTSPASTKHAYTATVSPTTTPTYVADWSQWRSSGQWRVLSSQQTPESQAIGNVLVSDGSAVCCNPGVIGILAPSSVATDTYILDAKIQVTGINLKAVKGQVYFGLLVHADTEFNGYLVGVLDERPATPSSVTFLNVLGLGTGLDIKQGYPLDTSIHDYRVEVKGYTVRFLIDSKLMFQSVSDALVQNKGFGLIDAGYQLKIVSLSIASS